MSMKRASAESNNDEQTNEGSVSLSQREDNAKRTHLDSLIGTTLQDLPIELLECILVKAVVMEVTCMKLVRRVWKKKADLAISKFATVCSRWSSILTTNFFRNEVHRILDGYAHETIRLEILHQSELKIYVLKVTTVKDEMFILCRPNGQDYVIHVYDRNNMAEVKAVIPLPGIRPRGIAACSVSNCVYLLNRKQWCLISVLRITKDDERQFTISPWKNLWLPNPTISVTANGSLIFSMQRWGTPAIISIFNANGSLQHRLRLSLGISSFTDVIPKPNGNLVLVSMNHAYRKRLTEIDTNGSILRQYNSPNIIEYKGVSHADIYGRLMITDRLHRIVLLDSEFNLLEFTRRQLDKEKLISPYKLHYNSERNEVISFVEVQGSEKGVLTIFRFTEE